MKPNYIVCERRISLSGMQHETWDVVETLDDILEIITRSPTCGFQGDYVSVYHSWWEITGLRHLHVVAKAPRLVRDVALSYSATEKGRVDIGLRGPSWDPPAVFWDSRGNSFTVIIPTGEYEGKPAWVSQQGVMLVSINGIGEVRWAVSRDQANWNENKEAVEHFGLTWGTSV